MSTSEQKFTHLHVHSHYSLLDGLAKIKDLINKAKECQMDALALTDHGVMYGAIEFYQECKKAGIKPIIGVEFYVAPNGRFNKRPKIDEDRYHLVLLAKNSAGYKNLLKLTTKAHLEGFYYRPRIDLELIKEHSDGLIALSACLQGEIPSLIIADKKNKALETAKTYQEIYGPGNFFLEIQFHLHLPEQKIVNEDIMEIARETGIPIVATNDIHYLNGSDDEAQDILLCLQTKKKLEDKDRLSMMGDDFSFKSPDQMIAESRDYPDAIENTQKISDACDLEIELGQVKLPRFIVPEGLTPEQYLSKMCALGVKERYGFDLADPTAEIQPPNQTAVNQNNALQAIAPQIVKERLEYELSIIGKTGFAPYLLIVQDFVNWSKNKKIIVGPGRGSAAGSLVSYLLNITNIDPIKYDLLFERFLNPERISMPDIDLDFADTRRDEVIEYVAEKYGRDHVSQIITFGTMAARAAIRDVGRVLSLAYNYCDGIAKMVPAFSNLSDALETNPELKTVYDSDPQAKKLIDTAKKLEGVARHASTHACGILITREPLIEYVPLQFDSTSDGKTIVSQYSMNPVGDLGLLKMDFLGLKNLTIFENTLKLIKHTKNQEIDINNLPLDDKKTFDLLRRADTTGVFQLESSGMKRYLIQLKPTDLEDIIAMVALYRPGPMEWIPDYIDGKHGKKKPNYLHPKLAPILNKTHGVTIYQEQVMQIARDLAGFTLGGADVLRKAMGKKIAELLAKQKEKFITGCIDNGVSKEIAEKIFAFIEPFAGYGFNRSHAACYAMIAYQTAYLKANYPAEFMASLLTSDQHDTDRIAIEVEECRRMGIQVLPPDINESFKRFTVVKAPESDQPNIRFGLLAIKNLGENIIETLITERQNNGNFQNLEDFLKRVQTKDLNKKSLESLIKCGALDRFSDRNQMLYNLDLLLAYNKNIQKELNNGQASLFGLLSEESLPRLRLQAAEETDARKKLSWEKELLGLYVSAHPFREFENYFKDIIISCMEARNLKEQDANLKTSNFVKVGGIITAIQKIFTRANEPMLFVKIEDTTAMLEVLIFPKLLQKTLEIWQEEKIVIVSGKASDKDGIIKVLGDAAWEVTTANLKKILEEAKKENHAYKNNYNHNQPRRQPPTWPINPSSNELPRHDASPSVKNPALNIIVPPKIDQTTSEKLKFILKKTPVGQHKVYLLFPSANDAKTKKIATNYFINYSDSFKNEIEQLIGCNSIFVDKF